MGVNVLLLKRGEIITYHPDLSEKIEEEDILLFCGTAVALKQLAARLG